MSKSCAKVTFGGTADTGIPINVMNKARMARNLSLGGFIVD
jgi:hypothetical protein